jgi:hypothetical protein
MHRFWRISSAIAPSRSRSVRLCYTNARSVTSGRKALIRIEGSTNRQARNNTCVYPGFACGLNPVLPVLNPLHPVPGSIPSACVQPAEEGWQFVNLATTDPPDCNLGLYVAFWSSPCRDDACAADAGGDTPSYGFFEVFDEPSQGISFVQFLNTILYNNRGRSFTYRGANVYTDYHGRNIFFEPGAPIDVWGILNDNDRDMTAWRPARGDIVRNFYPAGPGGQWRPSCVEVDNPVIGRRLVLDLSIHDHPDRCEFDIKPSNGRFVTFADMHVSPKPLQHLYFPPPLQHPYESVLFILLATGRHDDMLLEA